MRVDDRNLTGVPATESGRTQETQRSRGQDGVSSSSGSESGGGGGDQVQLSSTLGSLSRAMSAYGSDREDRIQQLAAQYRDGTYQPNPRATSQGLISEALAAGIR